MRTTWNGSISFGLVSIPVGLAPATASAARQSDVQFRMLHRECLTPIKQKRWCPVHDVEVGSEELVRGWEVVKGQFIPIEDEELEALEQRDTSRAIEITRFVARRRGRPRLLRPHVLPRPAGTEAQRRPYALLLEAMREDGVVGIGSFVLAGKEKLCLIRVEGRRARARDALRRRGREEPGRDRRGRRGDDGEEGGARAGAPADRRAPGRVRSGRAAQRVPRAAARAARREGRGPRAARARGGRDRDAGDRPDGGAPRLGRRLEDERPRRARRRAPKKPPAKKPAASRKRAATG